jgi:2-(1,2-epoxy-1,2-dihydrophenyl)acetyl-CoA isomerase
MDERPILERREGAVLVVTINRPHRANALDSDATAHLKGILSELTADPGTVRAVLLEGTGDHFCSGADIGGAGDASSGRPRSGHMVRGLAAGHHGLVETLWNCPLPVVARLHGHTAGMGLHLALACDFTVAAPDARFVEPFMDRGFNVDSGGSWLMQRAVGLTRAKQLIFLAEPIDAATAVQWGLIGEIHEDPISRALELAQQLAKGPTFAMGVTKRLLHDGLDDDLAKALRSEAAAIEITIRSRDFKEGITAFVEKREPDFKGD